METIRGRMSLALDFNELTERLTGYDRVLLDLGTGDGRYARHLADQHPDCFIIGIDSCRENLREHSQTKLKNMLFIIANAQELPRELNGLISHISINFPWGSLLEGLLIGELMCGLKSISSSVTSIDIRLNGGALIEAGMSLEAGAEKIHTNLLEAGWQIVKPARMNAIELRSFPSTWAKRLAFGRDPRAMIVRGKLAK